MGAKRTKSIKTLVIGLSLLVIFCVFAVQTGVGLFRFNNIVRQDIDTMLKQQTADEAENVADRIDEMGEISFTFANNVQAMPEYDEDIVLSLMKPYIASNSLIFGGGIWSEPFILNPKEKYYGPYLYKDNGSVQLTWDYSNQEYDYFQYDWYKIGFDTDKEYVCSEPFLDTVTNVAMMTVNSPIKKDGKQIGVATLDLGINELSDYVRSIQVGEKGYAFILTGQGYYLGNKTKSKDMTMRITEEKDAQTVALGKTILSKDTVEIQETSLNNNDCFIGYAPIGETGMKLVTVMPRSEVLGAVDKYVTDSMVVFGISMILLALFLYLLLSRKVAKPLNSLMQNAEKIAAGDLTVEGITSQAKDEIGHLALAFNTMLQNLRTMINQLQEKSLAVANSSTELSASAENIVAGTTETTSTISQVAVTVDQVSVNTQRIADLSVQAAGFAAEGSVGIENVTRQMSSIEQASIAVGNVIQDLSHSAAKISQIVEMIAEITDQTNLLALNAAIEAARAGEQGRGFAVVAEEVRRLAEQSAAAAKEIHGLISSVQQEIQQAVQSMEQGAVQVQKGNRVVETLGEIFHKINNSVEDLANEIQSVATATGQISSAMENVAAAAEEQTATMEEVSATSQTLAVLASEMENLSAKFRLQQ
ncbi:methyl-accepting chemotaxis protein [Candidatus Formimonas warabiya]|uniref:methyl-accepting chemotaxis protein n=1 Tax=Formimonas warabiya TaxID=1761012 RepID=UPI001BE3F397|nr:methyl-accepting chemotaxis protein [Candidatus Formimonas warabiya]